MINVIAVTISNENARVHAGEKISTGRAMCDGFPQRSVLAPVLLNCYTFDTPSKECLNFIYGVDGCLLNRHRSPTVVENLQHDADSKTDFYWKWKLKLNPSNFATVLYHIGPGKLDMKIEINNKPIPSTRALTYLGVISPIGLRMSTLTLVQSVTEIVFTVWGKSHHTTKKSTGKCTKPCELCQAHF